MQSKLKQSKLTKTTIEYGEKACNPFPGCLHGKTGICPVGADCWAKNNARLHAHNYPGMVDFTPTLYPEKLLQPLSVKKPSRILFNFMGDFFGDWVDPNQLVTIPITAGRYDPDGVNYTHSLRDWTFQTINQCPQHQFFFLTKAPWNLQKWGRFPDNAWVGATATDWLKFSDALGYLAAVDAKNRWLSIEPMLGEIKMDILQKMLFPNVISWVVIGGQTGRHPLMPKIEWVREIVEICIKAGILVWLKENLRLEIFLNTQDDYKTNLEYWWGKWDKMGEKQILRQELPSLEKKI